MGIQESSIVDAKGNYIVAHALRDNEHPMGGWGVVARLFRTVFSTIVYGIGK